jgi:hypothetical protein
MAHKRITQNPLIKQLQDELFDCINYDKIQLDVQAAHNGDLEKRALVEALIGPQTW